MNASCGLPCLPHALHGGRALRAQIGAGPERHVLHEHRWGLVLMPVEWTARWTLALLHVLLQKKLPAKPLHAKPNQNTPSVACLANLAKPDLASPCHSPPDLPNHISPHHASPCKTLPRLPRPNTPDRAKPYPTPPAVPDPATPNPASPNPATPSLPRHT